MIASLNQSASSSSAGAATGATATFASSSFEFEDMALADSGIESNVIPRTAPLIDRVVEQVVRGVRRLGTDIERQPIDRNLNPPVLCVVRIEIDGGQDDVRSVVGGLRIRDDLGVVGRFEAKRP